MFGVYDILETVGQGGMGVVYRAQDTALDRIVALKVLKEDLRQNKQVAARFQREAEAIASLNHPNIVHIYSVGAVGRIPYIAMEFIEGSPLSIVMKRVKSLPWKRALHIAEQVAEALACAHESHIIHRDIKPGNILVAADDRTYVTDFGIAKVLTAETQLTVEGSRLGTPHYMSPERCSKGDITPSSDLYSLGVVLFQMLSGRLPYEANSPIDLVRKIVREHPARLSEFVPDIPADVERLTAFLIEKKPADRPKTAGSVAEMCRRVIEGEPLFEDDGVASSLRDYRDSLPTPSSATTTHIDSALGEAKSLWTGAVSLWRNVPAAARLWAAGICMITVFAMAGQWLARRSFSDYALATVARWDRSTLGWSEPTAVASVVPESPGVSVARLHLPMHEVARLAQAGEAGFVVQLGGKQPNQHKVSTAILIVQPDTESVRFGIPPAPTHDAPTPRLVGGDVAATAAYFFTMDDTDGRVALYRGDSTLADPSYGTEVVSTTDLKNAAGVRASELTIIAVSPDTRELAVVARMDAGGVHHLLRVPLTGDRNEAAPKPVMLDAPQILALAYGEIGDLLVALRSGSELSVRRIPVAGTGREASLVAEYSVTDSDVIALDSSGIVLRTTSTPNAQSLAWHGFAAGEEWNFGQVSDAAIRPDGQSALVTAPDRRGTLQLWLVQKDSPEDTTQLTYLTSGIASEFEISGDGRYALCALPAGEPSALVLVNVQAAAMQ